MNDIKGKKLLILGAYSNEIEIVETAKRMGVYTIVTDTHTDWSLAPAKEYADEVHNISYSDYDALEKLCRENNIDGCIAGFSETRVQCLTDFCKRMGFPCYTEGADLGTIFDKAKFHEACKKCGIPVPGSYSIDDEIDEFPVIVRPVDAGGTQGTRICYNMDEVREAYEVALSFSKSGRVAIDEYLNGQEGAYWYFVHNGIVSLANSADRMMYDFGEGKLKQPVANCYPFRHLDKFVEKQDESFKKLITMLGIRNGSVLIQGIIKNDYFVPIEMGYRFDGSLSFHFPGYINGADDMEMMIRFALTGSMGDDEEISRRETPYFDKTGVLILLLLTKGTITEISGLDGIRDEKCVFHVFQKMNVGAECKETSSFSQVFARIYMCSEDKSELLNTINKIYDTVKVLDENGKNMLIGRYDADELK